MEQPNKIYLLCLFKILGLGGAESLKRVSELTGKDIPFAKCDLKNEQEVEKLFKTQKFDSIIHLAALKAVAKSVETPLEYYSNNLIGSLNLLNMCKKYGVKKFIFSSSATVYGLPKELPIREDSPTGQGLTNTYGQTKFMVEKILMDLAKAEKDWDIVILRYFNPVGAHPSGRIGEDPLGLPNNLMPFVAQVCIGRLPVLKIYGDKFDTPDGTGIRDYIHIMDLARGHVSALDQIKKNKQIGCEIYNLGTGKGYSVLEMVAALEKASGRKIPIEISAQRPVDVARMYCDPSLAYEKLGWRCEYGLSEMCRDLWNWQINNPYGYNKPPAEQV
uniref:UDP-glucose 4-epimerase n=1 Tax=Acrobeloides nanus TaxID=290746 RepID=A0A914E5C0_9BILA